MLVRFAKWIAHLLRMSKLKYLIVIAFVSVNVHFMVYSLLARGTWPPRRPARPHVANSTTTRRPVDEFAQFNEPPANETVADFQSFCSARGEWEHLPHVGFFKRTGAYFFSDASLIHFLLVAKQSLAPDSLDLELKLRVYHGQNEKSRMLVRIGADKINLNRIKFTANHALMTLDAKFDLVDALAKAGIAYDHGKYRVDAILADRRTKSATKRSMNLKIKEIFKAASAKKGVSICSQCVYLDTEASIKQFKWWLVQNKRIGIEKVFICNASIPNEPALRKFIRKNVDFITVSNLRCIPNFFSNMSDASQYIDKYSAVAKKRSDVKTELEVMDLLYENECYLGKIKLKFFNLADFLN